jgi:hypothetical protein
MATITLKPYIKRQFEIYSDAVRAFFARKNGNKNEMFLAKENSDDNAVIINKQVKDCEPIVSEEAIKTKFDSL